MKLFCGKDYPDNPPSVRFQTRINMTCVNQETGMVSDIIVTFISCDLFKYAHGRTNYQVEPSLFPMLANWQREYTMEDILTQLKKDMMSPQNRKLAQPPEGSFQSIFSKFYILSSRCIRFIKHITGRCEISSSTSAYILT